MALKYLKDVQKETSCIKWVTTVLLTVSHVDELTLVIYKQLFTSALCKILEIFSGKISSKYYYYQLTCKFRKVSIMNVLLGIFKTFPERLFKTTVSATYVLQHGDTLRTQSNIETFFAKIVNSFQLLFLKKLHLLYVSGCWILLCIT